LVAATTATGTGPKKISQACTTCGSLRGRHRPSSRKRRITVSCRGGGLCIMGCKLVRDVERFNDWGVKANYVVMKYGRKVNCLRFPDKVGKEAGTKQCGGGSRGGMNSTASSPACAGRGVRSCGGWSSRHRHRCRAFASATDALPPSCHRRRHPCRLHFYSGCTRWRRNSSGCCWWWMCRSWTKTGTTAATAGVAMLAAATAATEMGPKKISQARMVHGSLQGRHRPLLRKRRIMGSCRGGGPCIVGCKFVRDVERFNKWGVKADYAVMK
jgi:hypothetical protein